MLASVRELSQLAAGKNFSLESAKVILSKARQQYKAIEAFVIYFFPGDARKINRPIINEMEEEDRLGNYVVPSGFQYIEMLLYGDSAMHYQKQILNEADDIYALAGNFSGLLENTDISERSIIEAMQMEIVRQFMLGFANFETMDSRTGLPESAAMLYSCKEILKECFQSPSASLKTQFDELYSSVDEAVKYIGAQRAGTDPDFFQFYSRFYIPMSGKLANLRKGLVPGDDYLTAIDYSVRSIFDPGAFNSFFFLPAKKVASPAAVTELGRTLFFDPALSANNLRACASCHQPEKGFTDGLPLSQSFEPGKMLGRNAPTVLNAVFQRRLFHDGRVASFEDQAGQVMSNPLEMHNDFSQVAVKLRKSPEYVEMFKSSFAGSKDTLISSRSILTAIAEYERSITGMNSRFDQTITGRAELMNADEIAGFNLYMGKANCGSCHFLPMFNGTMPPEYTETEWEIIGVPSSKRSMRELDPDIGRGGVMDDKIFMHAFKPSPLRNIEITGPYMHNGVFRTLEEVVEFYDIGGGTGLGYEVPFQTLPEDSLHLNNAEKFQLVAFLKTLTDTTNITRKPSRLPEFPGEPKLNARPVGGDY